MKRKVILVLSIVMIFCLVACGKKTVEQQNSITGRWVIKEKPERNREYFYNELELFSDGTGVENSRYEEKWIAENGRLKIGDEVWSYTLNGDTLILHNDAINTQATYERNKN